MERIVLMGGPCSGQIHDVEADAPEVSALDGDGKRYVYVRTEMVDVTENVRVVIYRLAGPEQSA